MLAIFLIDLRVQSHSRIHAGTLLQWSTTRFKYFMTWELQFQTELSAMHSFLDEVK